MTGSFLKLYTFKGGKDGNRPSAGLVALNGMLYGTTTVGGGTRCKGLGCGVVFSLSLKSHAERVLHAFRGGEDGANPFAGLLVVNGTLYGTTVAGGTGSCHVIYSTCGTVFSITTSGTETVLHSFKGEPGDGESPFAGLINVKGRLYGTTAYGGVNGGGTVFSITPSGKEHVLHSFKGGKGDGDDPVASLLNVKGTLYGTTSGGGAHGDGTVFAITTSGTETVLYSFKRGSGDGEVPYASLINVKGTLYGTTWFGGGDRCNNSSGGSGNCGTLYTFDLASHKENIVHRFTGGIGGAGPRAAVRAIGDEMYGTTSAGGSSSSYCTVSNPPCGTIFSYVPKTNRFAVVYRLDGKVDGAEPLSNLIAIQGELYGTTWRDGGGFGTVFEYRP
jgi:uncharacterized repeat protein (TIGR03803 family)